jgi:hypothetical protein
LLMMTPRLMQRQKEQQHPIMIVVYDDVYDDWYSMHGHDFRAKIDISLDMIVVNQLPVTSLSIPVCVGVVNE